MGAGDSDAESPVLTGHLSTVAASDSYVYPGYDPSGRMASALTATDDHEGGWLDIAQVQVLKDHFERLILLSHQALEFLDPSDSHLTHRWALTDLSMVTQEERVLTMAIGRWWTRTITISLSSVERADQLNSLLAERKERMQSLQINPWRPQRPVADSGGSPSRTPSMSSSAGSADTSVAPLLGMPVSVSKRSDAAELMAEDPGAMASLLEALQAARAEAAEAGATAAREREARERAQAKATETEAELLEARDALALVEAEVVDVRRHRSVAIARADQAPTTPERVKNTDQLVEMQRAEVQ